MSAPPSRKPFSFALAGLFVAALTAAAVATTSPWPLRLPLHLALFIAAGLAWAAALLVLPRLPPTRFDLAILVAVTLLVRLPAWLAPPKHSDDVFRFAWDGRVARAGINPYRHPPDDPALAFLRDGPPRKDDEAPPAWERLPAGPTRGDGIFDRINNRDLPTIYPPGAQLLFLAAASLPLSPVASLKLLLGACDLGVLAILVFLLVRLKRDPRQALAWGWSPLVAIELGENAHLDAMPILCMVGALLAWQARRPVLAGLLLGGAAAAKLIGAPLLAGFRSPRSWVAAAAICLLLIAPFLTMVPRARDLVSQPRAALATLLAGAKPLAGSTGEFARRWRSNDGAYALVQAAADRAVCRALDAPYVEREGTPCDRPLDLWPNQDLATVISGRTFRAAVYPDELSAFLGRAFVGLLLACVVLGVMLRRLDPLRAMEWILGALLLLTPALKPWYAAWLLPACTLQKRPAWIALAVLVPLGYVPMAAWLGGAAWRDPIWSRLVEHGVCWALLAGEALGLLPTARPPIREVDPPPLPATLRLPA